MPMPPDSAGSTPHSDSISSIGSENSLVQNESSICFLQGKKKNLKEKTKATHSQGHQLKKISLQLCWKLLYFQVSEQEVSERDCFNILSLDQEPIVYIYGHWKIKLLKIYAFRRVLYEEKMNF